MTVQGREGVPSPATSHGTLDDEHWRSNEAIQDIARLLYHLTGASTERQAVLAYNVLYDRTLDLGDLYRERGFDA